MSAYDLSTMVEGRVAGQPVDMLRVANVDVWAAASGPAPTQYATIFGGAAPGGSPLGYTDAGDTSVLCQQFYVPAGGQTLTIDAVGIYAVGPVIGRTGSVGLMRRLLADGGRYQRPGGAPNEFYTNGARRVFTEPLVAGWNFRPLAGGPYQMAPGDSILACYNLGGGYVYEDNGMSTAEFVSADANFRLVEYGTSNGVDIRCMYAATWGLALNPTNSRFYGIDLRVEVP